MTKMPSFDKPTLRELLAKVRLSSWIVGGFSLVHFVLILGIPLTADETYYWDWSRHLDFGYFDQGPMIAVAIRASCTIFGETVIGIRFVPLLASLILQVFTFRLSLRAFGERVALWAIAPFSLSPLGIGLGVISTYDVLLVALWVVSVHFTLEIIEGRSRLAPVWLGVTVGLGTLSKYSMMMFVPCVALFLLSSPNTRKWFGKWHFYASLAIAFLLLAPNLFWQSGHDWATFAHTRGITSPNPNTTIVSRSSEFLAVQALIISPILFVMALRGFATIWRNRNQFETEAPRLALFASFPVLLYFLALSFTNRVLANWPICGWLFAGAASSYWVFSEPARIRRRLPWLLGSMAFSVVVVAIALLIVSAPSSLKLFGPTAEEKFAVNFRKVLGGRELGAKADECASLLRTNESEPIYVAADAYQECSRLAFFMKGQPQVVCLFLGTRPNQYVYWNEANRIPKGGSAVVVLAAKPTSDRARRLGALFQSVTPWDQVLFASLGTTHKKSEETFYFYLCRGYKPDPTVTTPTDYLKGYVR